MPNAIYYVAYKLKKSASIPDFLLATETLNNESVSKQKGYISWEQFRDGETWADMLRFETAEDLENFKETSKNPSEAALHFYSFINLPSCKMHAFTLEKKH